MGAKLSPYDTLAMIPSGTVLTVGLYLIYCRWPAPSDLQSLNGGFGDFGLILLGILVAGELIHAIARIFERIFWYCIAGWPTERLIGHACDAMPEHHVFEGMRRILEKWSWSEQLTWLSESQKRALHRAIKQRIWHNHRIERSEIAGITREMYAQVFNAKRSERIDVFNRNYGMYSGLFVAFVILAAVACRHCDSWSVWLCVGASVICMFAIWTTGYDYAGELVLQFLNLPPKEVDKGAKGDDELLVFEVE